MQSKAATAKEYLLELPEPRRAAISAVRSVILANLDKDVEEGMGYGMITYSVPHRVFPAGYHCNPKLGLPYASLASQKNHMALYFMCLYAADTEFVQWFHAEWAKTGKKIEMGKSCIRFKEIDDLPLPLIGKAVKRVTAKVFIRHYETALAASRKS